MFKCSDVKMLKGAQAFTLVEILVVIGIIILLSSIGLGSYRAGKEQFALLRTANQLAQDIRSIQERAMSASQYAPLGYEEYGVIPKGYGIYFYTQAGDTKALLFADCDGDNQFSGTVCGSFPNIFSEEIREVVLEPEVEIKELWPFPPFAITFVPPDPSVFISGGILEVRIVLSLKSDPTKTKMIKVNQTGLIDIE